MAKWTCAVCGQPLCSACKPVAYAYKIFHRECLEKKLRKLEPVRAVAAASDGPSTGVKGVAWSFIVSAILWLGAGLLALGIALFSRHYLPAAGWLGNPFPVLDDIPGSRALIGWFAGISFAAVVIQVWIGLGLLNCAPGARRALLIFAWLEVGVAVLGWLVVLLAQEGFWDIPVIAVGLIIFFSRKNVKAQFAPAK